MPRTTSKAELAFATELGDGLRRARVAAGLTYREASIAADLDQSSVFRIEKGTFKPTLETIATLMVLYRANLNIGPDGLMVTWMEQPKGKGDDA